MTTKPEKDAVRSGDVSTLQSANEVLDGTSTKGFLLRTLPFLGPAFIASIAYIDPGNYATNILSGAQFGYELLWVIVAHDLMAMLVQTLAAKLGHRDRQESGRDDARPVSALGRDWDVDRYGGGRHGHGSGGVPRRGTRSLFIVSSVISINRDMDGIA